MARVGKRQAQPPWAHLGVKGFFSHVAHRSGNKRRAAQLPDHDNFTAGSAVSHLTGRSLSWRCRKNGASAFAIWERSVDGLFQSGNSSRVSTFLGSPVLRSASRLMGSTRCGAAHLPKFGVDEPLVAADDADCLGRFMAMHRSNAGNPNIPSGSPTCCTLVAHDIVTRHAAFGCGGVGAGTANVRRTAITNTLPNSRFTGVRVP